MYIMSNILGNKRLNIIIALVSLLLLITMVQDTYAKYVSSAKANTNFTIATWAFNINQQDVLGNSNFSNTITPVFLENSNIKPGVIAPTSEGYFDILIDASSTDVSFTETITITNPTNSPVKDLLITGYKKNDEEVVEFTEATRTITTDHLLTDTNKVTSYRIFIKWYDGEDEIMDNEADTNASQRTNTNVDVDVQFIQKAN